MGFLLLIMIFSCDVIAITTDVSILTSENKIEVSEKIPVKKVKKVNTLFNKENKINKLNYTKLEKFIQELII